MKDRTRKNGTPEYWTETPTDKITALKSIMSNHQMSVIDGNAIDAQTANAMLVLYNGLNDNNKARYIKMSLAMMAKAAFDLLK